MALGSVVVVPVVSPVSAAELARVAARIAAADGGCVIPISAVAPDADPGALKTANATVEAAVAAAREAGVDAEGVVRDDRPVTDAVLGCMTGQRATLAVMGWQGASTQRNIFGELIDSIVGRSTIPLAVVRVHPAPYERVLLPLSADHLVPQGSRGVRLAAELARRLLPEAEESVTVLHAGPSTSAPLPVEVKALGARQLRDPRRLDLAVGAAAGKGDLVVAPVAPTASGLRMATTHMAWAAPEVWLAVAIDMGPPPGRDEDLAQAVADAGAPPRRLDG